MKCTCGHCGEVFDAAPVGGHRVLCGDALDLAQARRLTGDITPDLANCDPPYGISVVKGARNAIIDPGVYAEVIGDDSIDTALGGYAVLMELGVPAIVLWGGNYYAHKLPPSRCWLVWDKENTGSFADAELAWTNQDKTVRLLRHQWSGLIKASERGERRVHPTQKPVALAAWVIETVAPEAKAVIDLFLGSGSTLIACQLKDICCFGVELAPSYIDVCVLRWEKISGKRAILSGSGRPFSEISSERKSGRSGIGKGGRTSRGRRPDSAGISSVSE